MINRFQLGYGQAVDLQVGIDLFQRTNLAFPHDSPGVFNPASTLAEVWTLLGRFVRTFAAVDILS